MTAMYKHLFEEFNLDVLSAECWTATPVMFDGLAPCALYGLLNEMGLMVSCESDMHCAMTMALLKCATLGKGRPLFGEFTGRHPENRNAELLWHCGPFPVSEMAEGTKGAPCEPARMAQRKRRRVHGCPYRPGARGLYDTAAYLPHDRGTADPRYIHMGRVCKNLQAVEEQTADGPYIHHFVEMRGDYRKEIKEFCKYVPALTVDKALD